jgi:hypothetical protein
MRNNDDQPIRVRGDFNGLFRGGAMLCLSHRETCPDEKGNQIALHAGMRVTAFDEDLDEHGNRDDLIASGVVERAPDWLQCRGSKWVLMIDEDGVKHESDVRDEEQGDPPSTS